MFVNIRPFIKDDISCFEFSLYFSCFGHRVDRLADLEFQVLHVLFKHHPDNHEHPKMPNISDVVANKYPVSIDKCIMKLIRS